MAMEYGPSGPTAVKDIDASGTGFSNEAASFITANCSPFTNPRDMPCAPKVPDPRNTQTTNTAFLWHHFDIPVVAMDGPMGQTTGEQIIVTSADPLSPVPISWCNTGFETDIIGGNSSATPPTVSTWIPAFRTPNSLARDYETAGLGKLIKQIADLADRSKSYRIVGHGLKVWVSRNTSISRGNIEAGQYSVAGCRNATAAVALTRSNDYFQRISGYPANASSGMQGALMNTSAITTHRNSIRNGKEQEIGFLAADEGCTVRWTDSNEFQFQPTYQRSLCYPNSISYGDIGYSKMEPTALSRINGLPLSQNHPMAWPTGPEYRISGTDYIDPAPNGPWPFYDDLNEITTLYTNSNTASNAYYVIPTVNAGLQSVRTWYYAPGDGNILLPSGQDMTNYLSSPTLQFDKGLYADISGLDPSQVLTVQVCWQVEYTPKNTESWTGEDSPVDMNYDMISAMVRDRRAFPIVVKGHSFFSSLKKALGKAANFVGKIFASAGGTVGSALVSTGDPRLMAAGTGISLIGGMFAAKRKRAEEHAALVNSLD